MKIYTKSGDEGFTNLPGGRRVRKSDSYCRAVGTLDELNAHLGLCIHGAESVPHTQLLDVLTPVQADLLVAGSMVVAAAAGSRTDVGLADEAIRRLEAAIDEATKQLPPLTHFILPGGCELACRLHVARTVCRRVERNVIAAEDAGVDIPAVVHVYLNRLGDLLFTLARLANHKCGGKDVLWKG